MKHFSTPDGRDMQRAILRPGASIIGALDHEGSAWYGLDERDPTCDRRVIGAGMRSGLDAVAEREYRREWTGDPRSLKVGSRIVRIP